MQSDPTVASATAPFHHGSMTVREVIPTGGELLFRLEGQIKHDTDGLFQEYFEARLVLSGLHSATLDCSRVIFVDSQGLALLLLLEKKCSALGGSFGLRAANASLCRLVTACRLDRFIRMD